jgi:hypothetical protein
VSFLAEQIAGWSFDSEQHAICAAEKFNEVAVSANLEDKTELLFVTEVVEDKSGGWRVRFEQSNGGGWTGPILLEEGTDGGGTAVYSSLKRTFARTCQRYAVLRLWSEF